MNTQSIPLTTPSSRARKDTPAIELNHRAVLATVVRWSVAGTIALSVVIAGIWAATNPNAVEYLSAGLWATGFLFLALTLEVNIKRVVPLILTGLALPVLALLGSRVAEEFSVLAVAIVAGWLAIGIASWIGRRG